MFGARGPADLDGLSLRQDLKLLDGIASWCGALHGSMPLDDALSSLASALGASAAIITRDTRNEDRARLVAEWDAQKSDPDVERIRRGFASDVLGTFYNKMRGGSVWFLSDLDTDQSDETNSRLANWRLSRGVEEIVVISLEATGIQHDYLEFHFTRSLSDTEKLDTENVLPTLVRAWTGRQTGLVTQAQMDERMIRAREAAKAARLQPEDAILGMSNPARLSRAEFRVCLLLSRGLSVKAVTEELGLSEATVRSHLRSIYSKTRTSGLAELLYRILSNTPERSDVAYGTN